MINSKYLTCQDFPDTGVFESPLDRERFAHSSYAAQRVSQFMAFPSLQAIVDSEIACTDNLPLGI